MRAVLTHFSMVYRLLAIKPTLLLGMVLSFSQHAALAQMGATEFEGYPGYPVIKNHLVAAANEFNIEYELLHAVVAKESRFDPLAVSPGGAIGLMQIMPATAANFGVRGDKNTSIRKKLSDPVTNVNTGSRYLRYLMNLFPGQLELAVAAYNAGEGTVRRAGNKIPNIKATQQYVKSVLQTYAQLKSRLLSPDRTDAPTKAAQELPDGVRDRDNVISTGASMDIPLPSAKLPD